MSERRGGDRGGFALALVVLMLFAVAVAGITGYQVVSTEMSMATQSRDGQAALTIARAGLQRFIGETVGEVGDSVSYTIGDGYATVTTRKIYEQDSRNHLYYIESEGTVTDARTPNSPATRTVATYAWHRLYPVPLNGALWVSGGTLRISGNYYGVATVNGTDHSTSGECTGSPSSSTAGIVKGAGTISTSSGGTYSGSPNSSSYGSYAAMYDTTGIRWDILKSSNFPVDFDGTNPGFIATDSFPIVRYNGDLNATWSWQGQGVLIVTGTLTINYGFYWRGIVLAGGLASTASWAGWWTPQVYGMLIGGMNGANSSATLSAGDYFYEYCYANGASKALSYLEVVDNAIFEVNG